MRVKVRGVLYPNIEAAAKGSGIDPVALHLELARLGMEAAEPWFTYSGDGYIEDEQKPIK